MPHIKYCTKCGSVIVGNYEVYKMNDLCDLCIGDELIEPRKNEENRKIMRDIIRKSKKNKHKKIEKEQ
jgi:hypothetical protein